MDPKNMDGRIAIDDNAYWAQDCITTDNVWLSLQGGAMIDTHWVLRR